MPRRAVATMSDDKNEDGLRFGALSHRTLHICVDMQRLFAEDTPWQTPWMPRVLPRVAELVSAAPSKTVFTRFIPAQRPGDGAGTWARYWQRWEDLTLERIDLTLLDLVTPLDAYAGKAQIVDKTAYSPWLETAFTQALGDADTLIVSGGETDVCVLATVLGAVDRGYRIILPTDALCSSSDETHDALLTVYHRRYGQQVETIPTADLLRHWPR